MSPQQEKKLVCAFWMGIQAPQQSLLYKHWNSCFGGQQAGLVP